jgi:hypothetical protein
MVTRRASVGAAFGVAVRSSCHSFAQSMSEGRHVARAAAPAE